MSAATSSTYKHPYFSAVVIFLTTIVTMADMAVTPIYANVYEAYAEAPVALINFGIGGSALCGIPFLLLSGWLCDRMDKKILLVLGMALATLSSVFGAAVDNVYWWVGCRLLLGVAWGFTNTVSLTMLAELFTDEAEHGKMVGFYNAVMSGLGAILAFGGGVFALGGWQHAYRMYLLMVPILVLCFFLPKMPPHRSAVADEGSEAAPAEDTKGWWTKQIPLALQMFLIAVCYFVCLYMISLYVADAGVGNEAFVGSISSAMTIAGAIGSVCFGFAYQKMRNAVYIPFVFIIAILFFVMGFFPSAPVTIVCCAVMGFCWPMFFAYAYTRCAEIAPPSKVGAATGLIGFADGFAAFACSYLLTGLMGATGMSSVGVWPIVGGIMLATIVVSAIVFFAHRGKSAAIVATTE